MLLAGHGRWLGPRWWSAGQEAGRRGTEVGRETAALRTKTLEEEGEGRIGGFCFCGLVDLWRPRSSLLGLLDSSPCLRGRPIMSYSGGWPNNASDFFECFEDCSNNASVKCAIFEKGKQNTEVHSANPRAC